jgi:hypothetical protein
MIHASELMPCLVMLTKGSQHDHTFLKHLNLAEGSYVVMDKGTPITFNMLNGQRKGFFTSPG